MTKPEATTEVATTGAKTPEVLTRFQSWAADIEAGTEDTATLAILATIAAASNPASLSAGWTTTETEKLLNRVIVVTGLKKMPSDYAQGLGFFLVVSGYDPTTGEEVTFTSGSVGVAGQLVKAHHEGWLPLKCELVRSPRPTKNGYYPEHLRVYGSPEAF